MRNPEHTFAVDRHAVGIAFFAGNADDTGLVADLTIAVVIIIPNHFHGRGIDVIKIFPILAPAQSVGNGDVFDLLFYLQLLVNHVKVSSSFFTAQRHAACPETPCRIGFSVIEAVAFQMFFRIAYRIDFSGISVDEHKPLLQCRNNVSVTTKGKGTNHAGCGNAVKCIVFSVQLMDGTTHDVNPKNGMVGGIPNRTFTEH